MYCLMKRVYIIYDSVVKCCCGILVWLVELFFWVVLVGIVVFVGGVFLWRWIRVGVCVVGCVRVGVGLKWGIVGKMVVF